MRAAWVLEWPNGSICHPTLGLTPKVSSKNLHIPQHHSLFKARQIVAWFSVIKLPLQWDPQCLVDHLMAKISSKVCWEKHYMRGWYEKTIPVASGGLIYHRDIMSGSLIMLNPTSIQEMQLPVFNKILHRFLHLLCLLVPPSSEEGLQRHSKPFNAHKIVRQQDLATGDNVGWAVKEDQQSYAVKLMMWSEDLHEKIFNTNPEAENSKNSGHKSKIRTI